MNTLVSNPRFYSLFLIVTGLCCQFFPQVTVLGGFTAGVGLLIIFCCMFADLG